MNKLSLDPPLASKSQAQPIADSWEDESSETETEDAMENNVTATPPSQTSKLASEDYPSAPPPTPASPSMNKYFTQSYPYIDQLPSSPLSGSTSSSTGSKSRGAGSGDERRPETTATVARRLIAAGLGVKAPTLTEERKEYERAIREKEKGKIAREKEEARRIERERDEARKSVWED